MVKTKGKYGLSDAGICRLHGWEVGTQLVGDEGYGQPSSSSPLSERKASWLNRLCTTESRAAAATTTVYGLSTAAIGQ